jgi:hypothetical protein
MITTYELVWVQDKDMADKRFKHLRQFKFSTPGREWPPKLGEWPASSRSRIVHVGARRAAAMSRAAGAGGAAGWVAIYAHRCSRGLSSVP